MLTFLPLLIYYSYTHAIWQWSGRPKRCRRRRTQDSWRFSTYRPSSYCACLYRFRGIGDRSFSALGSGGGLQLYAWHHHGHRLDIDPDRVAGASVLLHGFRRRAVASRPPLHSAALDGCPPPGTPRPSPAQRTGRAAARNIIIIIMIADATGRRPPLFACERVFFSSSFLAL